MSEDVQAPEEAQQVFQIQKIYTKDISFESPNAPQIFTEDFEPQLEVDLNVATDNIAENLYHVVVMVTATTKVGETVAFLCEVEQAGIFTIEGFDEDEIAYILGAQCPSVLFPYAREVISDLVTRGGFPQLLLEPVNFDAMFAGHLEQAQADAS
jgi:preprotein translocase subunit SecB